MNTNCLSEADSPSPTCVTAGRGDESPSALLTTGDIDVRTNDLGQPRTLGEEMGGLGANDREKLAPEGDGASLGVEEGNGRGTSVMTLSNRGRAKFGASVTTSAISASRPPASAAETNDTDGQPDSDTAPKDDSLSSSSGEEESAAGNSGNESDRPQLSTSLKHPEGFDWRKLKPRRYGKSLPPLDPAERENLEQSIKSHGFLSRILIDELLNIVDGNHRWTICMETGIAPAVEVIQGLSKDEEQRDLEKEELALSCNLDRRQLDTEDASQVFEARLDNLLNLRQKDPKTWTLKKIAELLSVSIATVSARGGHRHISAGKNVSVPDARRKYDDELKREAIRLVKEGMPHAEVSRKVLIPPKTLQRAVNEEKERESGGGAAKGGKLKKAAAAKPPQPIKDITATEGVPDLHRRCLDYLGKDASVFAEWLKAAVEKAREDSEARFADADSELAADDVEELNKSTLYHIQRANLDTARLRRIVSAGGEADVKEAPAGDSCSDGAGPTQVGDYLLGIVSSVEPDQVFVTLPVFGGGVIDNHNDGLAKYGLLTAGGEVRVRVAGFDRKRGLWKLQPQGRQTVAPAPGAIAGSHRDDRCSPSMKVAGLKAGPKDKEVF